MINTEVNTKMVVSILFFAGVFFQNSPAQSVAETISKEEATAFWQSFKTFCLYKDVSHISQFVTDTLMVTDQETDKSTTAYFTAKQVKKDMHKTEKKSMELVPRWNGMMAVIGVDNRFTTQINVNEYAPKQQPEYATRSVEFKINPECVDEYIYSTAYRLHTFESSTIYYFRKLDGQIKLYKKSNKKIDKEPVI